MNTEQLLIQVRSNCDLIIRHNEHAVEHLHMLRATYHHLLNEEIELNMELSNSYVELNFKSNYAGAAANSLATLDKFKNTKHKDLIARHQKIVGICYAHLGEPDLAERYLLGALENITEKHKDYIAVKTDTLHALAMAEDFKDDNSDKIIPYLTEALKLIAPGGETIRKGNLLMGIGNVHNNKENINEALKHYLEAAAIFENAYALLNMASAYSNIGNCYLKLEDFKRAEKYLEKSLELRIKFGSPDQVSISYFNLALIYKETGEYERCEELLMKTLKIVEEVGNKPFKAQVEEELDDLACKKKNANAA